MSHISGKYSVTVFVPADVESAPCVLFGASVEEGLQPNAKQLATLTAAMKGKALAILKVVPNVRVRVARSVRALVRLETC